MIDWLEHIDQQLLLWINSKHNPFFDLVFWSLSKSVGLLPFYILTMYYLITDYKLKKAIYILGFIVVCLAITDLVSTQVFKEGIKRYRPSHHTTIGPKLHLHEEKPGVYYRGGQYGFISSHASNIAGFVAFIYPWFCKKRPYWIYILSGVGLLVCYSRIYLGVHYPSDIVAGILFGGFVGWIIGKLSLKLIPE